MPSSGVRPHQMPAAVLFDMDGLLVDTEPLWTVAEVELADRLGGVWTDELKARVVGSRLEVAVPTILLALGHRPTPPLVVDVSRQLLTRMTELFADDLPARPGALELLEALQSAGVPVALVSSSYRILVDAVLNRLDLNFNLSIAGDEVGRAKPDPEPYLTAAARLGQHASACVVLEDSPAGVVSAEAAGCAVVAVPSVVGVHFDSTPRRRVVSSLSQIGLPDLGALIRPAAQPEAGALAR
ncbi:MAG: HAD-superfamily hydrolase, subfamily variant 3 [Frankiales bacterium]|nr:HAD-superfamily hydrolase, subfamily variant 3 [Frankiales bacterium]